MDRSELERIAEALLGKHYTQLRMDLDDAGVLARRIILARYPDAGPKLAGASQAYLEERVRLIGREAGVVKTSTRRADVASGDARTTRRLDDGRNDTEATIARAREAACDAWRQPLGRVLGEPSRQRQDVRDDGERGYRRDVDADAASALSAIERHDEADDARIDVDEAMERGRQAQCDLWRQPLQCSKRG